MPRKYVKRTRRPGKRTRRPRKRTGQGYVTKAQVRKMIGRRLENKKDWNGGEAGYVYNVAAAQPYVQSLNWDTTQGTGQGNRTGNELTVKQAKLKISLSFASYDVTNNPRLLEQLVTVFVYKVRQYANGTNPSYSTFFNKMFQNGNSTATLANVPTDHIQPFNKDIMMVKAVRRFKMGFSNNSSVVVGLGSSNIHPNNDFNYQKFVSIDCTKFYKKTQKFNDTTTNAYNDNLFMSIYTCPADGSAYSVPAAGPLKLSWFMDKTFEDA